MKRGNGLARNPDKARAARARQVERARERQAAQARARIDAGHAPITVDPARFTTSTRSPMVRAEPIAKPIVSRKQRVTIADPEQFRDPRPGCQHPACPGGDRGPIQQHHVVYQQELRRWGGDLGNPAWACALHERCHGDHHSGVRRLPTSAIRDDTIGLATALMGAGPTYEWLRRHYTVDDPRLGRLINAPSS